MLVEHDEDVGRSLDLARALAAPAALLAKEKTFELWAVRADEEAHPVLEVSYLDLYRDIEQYRRELDPELILRSKQATRQLTLFPADVAQLLQNARHHSASRLTERVEEAMGLATANADMSSRKKKLEVVERASGLVVTAMAALMVTDKIDGKRPKNLGNILDVASRHFPGFFAGARAAFHDAHPGSFEAVVSALGEGITYAGLDPNVASHVYESAVVSAASREKLGVFYTPPDLASKVLAQIPFEEIPPDARTVLDPACGSGTLLIAAHERLAAIAPSELDYAARHDYVAANIHGSDSDPFAVEIARLALLLNALPAGNGWNVRTRDALAETLVTEQATVVVSNPPWLDIKSGRRTQLADGFVTRMLDMVKPGGFLAVILPANWLDAGTSRAARRLLEERATLFELWRLPENAFASAELAPVVLFAQEGKSPGRPYVFRRMLRRNDWRKRFFESVAGADEQVITSHGSGLTADTLLRGPMDDMRERFDELSRLRDVADISTGPVPTPPVSIRGGEGEHFWLPKHGRLRGFQTVPDHLLVPIHYPDEFDNRGEDDSLYWRRKVLVSKVRKADNPWRVKTLVDDEGGVIPRDSLFLVAPHADSPKALYALTAMLGSAVASIWIDTLVASRSVPLDVLAELPIPPEENWSELAAIGKRVVKLADAGELTRPVVRELDDAVMDAYELPKAVRTRIARHLAGFAAPEKIVRYELRNGKSPKPTSERLRFPGAVLDARPGAIHIWISGLTPREGEWLPLPQHFLAWHVRPGAIFEAIVPDQDFTRAEFVFQREGYRELDELLMGEALTNGR
jgi:predicted RNA methylase